MYLGVIGPAGSRHYDLLRLVENDTVHQEHALEVIEAVGLEDRVETPTGDLSHGERRQLEVGLAIAYKPRLVMLDEPAAGLSPEERYVLMDLLNGLEQDITLLLIEHDMDVAFNVSERVTVLNDGSIIEEGTPEEISANDMVQKVYLGERLDD